MKKDVLPTQGKEDAAAEMSLGSAAESFSKPGLALLSKLASITVHVTEMRSSDGHEFDQIALDSLLADAEVKCWLAEMGGAALAPLPRKRNPQEPGL